jgi:tripartite-type tricarboxylate transporter receptor subunit TctC
MYRNKIALLPIAICALLLCLPAGAQTWPTKPVRLVVPYAAGGNTDSIARIAAQKLSLMLEQQFIVENRPGAGGTIAAEYVARAAPDGYTIFFGSLAPISILPLIRQVRYDPVKDFVPISIVGTNYFMLGVSLKLPVRTLKEFIAHVKANPGQLNYASGGEGTVSHVTGALFLSRAGLNMVHIPYKGGAPAVTELLAGQVQMYFGNASEILQHAQSGKISILAMSGERRDSRYPAVPAIAELLPGFHSVTWNGPMAPAGTPQVVIDRMAQALIAATRQTEVIESLHKIGVDALGNTPAEFAALIKNERALWQSAVGAAGMQRN